MNFFTKNRFLTWLLIFLVAVNLTILVTFMVYRFRKPAETEQQACSRSCMAFSKELSLTSGQSGKVDAILAGYRNGTEPFVARIRECRVQLLEELAKENPDTALVSRCTEEISGLQKQLQMASVKQYLALKEICTPDQCRKLSALYFELYGCQAGNGKGMMNRHRHGADGKGQAPAGSSCCAGE